MSISPSDQEKKAREIRRIYEEAELRILLNIGNRIKKGINMANWQKQKLAQINQLRLEIERELNEANKQIPELINEMIKLAYLTGSQSVGDDLKEAFQKARDNGVDPREVEQLKFIFEETELTPQDTQTEINSTIDNMMGVNVQAIEALAASTVGAVVETKTMVLRQILDAYRDIISEVAGSTLTGAETRLEIADRALAKFSDRGIASFKDKSGRVWNISSYTEMATRTAIGHASIEGHANQMEDFNMDLVMVSDHAEECRLCRPFEGKILSLSGAGGYVSLKDAQSDGLFHPNCSHRLQTYVKGLTQPLKKTADPAGDKERQKHRYLERQLRKWKKREQLAMSKKEKRKAKAKVKEYKGKMNDFIDDTGRRRKRNRERVPDVAR